MMTEKTNAQRGNAEGMPSDRADRADRADRGDRGDRANRDRCPLCGGPNGCAIEAGRQPESCWCMRRTIGEDVLAGVPPQLRGAACICPICAAGGG
ncbi:cysteine-rich CWC family protein [Cohnella rhizosphaerae]|uniref:Cysteine-rich CWC family protein n=1 Tax=Cohnella rhizosphaerae TaxID=1457232 RepID=A0A9X4KZN1_9BACL|nr:cysteine-rich CWC family protein [Cohnella rhizosphaerae]MDG0814296.1 cysteine-rich CWC family protein [Cohnella rhizosphaerae]